MNRTRQLFLHAVVWLAILLFFLFVTGNGSFAYRNFVVIVYFGLINIGLFYTNYLFLLPQFFNRKKYWYFALAALTLVLVVGFFKYGLASFYEDIVLIRGAKKQYYVTFHEYYISSIFVSSLFIFLSTALKFTVDWFVNESVRSNLENEKLNAELAFLKSQINPHFLFNSLNNIYSLAYQKSTKTAEAILKLSEIMRYMLYESNDDKVDLSKELTYLQNYMELQKLRFKDGAFVELDIKGETSNQTIMPLVLISFVENAFKHGVATDEQNPIRITIQITEGKLFFRVVNKKGTHNKDETGGIGLLNVQRRLDLLYKNKHHLQIENGTSFYTCELYLDL
ncbi:MAG: histidine kinase [Daejeonella sp.]